MLFYCFELDKNSKHVTMTMHHDGTLLEYKTSNEIAYLS